MTNYREPADEKAFFAKFNLMEAMKDCALIKDDIQTYHFRYNKLYRAIRDYIDKNDGGVLIDIDKEHRVTSVTYTNCHLYPDDWKGQTRIPTTLFCLQLYVSVARREDDRMESPPEHGRSYDIQVPIDLQNDFSLRKFDEWIRAMRAIKEEELAKIEEKELARLIKKYPGRALGLIGKREANV